MVSCTVHDGRFILIVYSYYCASCSLHFRHSDRIASGEAVCFSDEVVNSDDGFLDFAGLDLGACLEFLKCLSWLCVCVADRQWLISVCESIKIGNLLMG